MWRCLEKVKNVKIKFLFPPATPQIKTDCVRLIVKVSRPIPYFSNMNTITCHINVLSIHIVST